MIDSLKIALLFTFHDGPWGGGNQFLRALAAALVRRGALAESPADADAVLFNSHHDLKAVLAARRAYPTLPFIHRVDGPMGLYNETGDPRDAKVTAINQAVADATLFQSNWSQEQNRPLGLPNSPFQEVIGNAPDPALFHPPAAEPPTAGRIRLIASSWSVNPKKGFDFYQFLDRNLDFDRFEMNFLGRSPEPFANIRILEPLPSPGVAETLKRHHIFITGSHRDPCSNALLEALHCGLPALARNDGGHPEIVGKGGELFDKKEEAIPLLEKIATDPAGYAARIDLPSIDAVAEAYLAFAATLRRARAAGDLPFREPLGLFKAWRLGFGSR